jgi:carboxypeptidase Q
MSGARASVGIAKRRDADAHLDSWELGSGALDNGADCALVIEVARAIRAAGTEPRRTPRFAQNGEEQGLHGSWADARDHRAERDCLVTYVNFDAGTGPVTGYSPGGRGDTLGALREDAGPARVVGHGRTRSTSATAPTTSIR